MRLAVKKSLLYFNTLRRLRSYQIWGRLGAVVKQKLRLKSPPEAPEILHFSPPGGDYVQMHDPWNNAASIAQGAFTFLNQLQTFGDNINWVCDTRPMLWRFNLHYFHWIHLLDAEKRLKYCRDWIAANPPYTPVAWHPYPTSLRIINWCKMDVADAGVIKSLYLQTAYLSRHLETYLSGNHVIENARALILASRCFGNQGEAPQWLDKGLSLLLKETREQILDDGAHYERSPMYHALMLEAYLDALNALPAGHAAKTTLARTVAAMADFLHAMTHPDGNIALFNDATQEIAHPTKYLVAQVQKITGHRVKEQRRFEHAGYFIHRSPACYLVIDSGPIGPDHIPAHAHADVFSFELSLHGVQFVVDAGVFEYQAGAMRDYVRSTKAHNTVTVDGLDQAECWSAFRVGRRFAPRDVTFESDGRGSRFEGAFDGFATLIGDQISHHRKIEVDDDSGLLTVVDTVTGKGNHAVESRLHLHPEVEVEEITSSTFKLSRAGVACELHATAQSMVWEESWYCPRFGLRLQNKVLVMKGEAPAELRCDVSYRH